MEKDKEKKKISKDTVYAILTWAGIILLALFSFGIKEKAVNGIIDNVPEYNCEESNLCTSCIVKGNICNCNQHTCECGNVTIDRKECTLL